MSSTAVVCAECGIGNFEPESGHALTPQMFECDACGNEETLNEFEVNLGDGETLITVNGLLAVVGVCAPPPAQPEIALHEVIDAWARRQGGER